MVDVKKERRALHDLFEIGVILKGMSAVLELILGCLLLFVNVGGLVTRLTAGELVEDPQDFLANHLRAIAGHISPRAQLVSALYLLFDGLIKVVLVWGLLRDKLWAYPAAIAVLTLFIAYQVITYTRTFSIALLVLTVFDVALIFLIWYEYRAHAKRLGVY